MNCSRPRYGGCFIKLLKTSEDKNVFRNPYEDLSLTANFSFVKVRRCNGCDRNWIKKRICKIPNLVNNYL